MVLISFKRDIVHCRYSVVLLTHKRLELLKNCLSSILLNEKLAGLKLEVLICLNGKDDETASYLKDNSYDFLYLENSLRVGEARNLLIDKAQGEYLIFIDDDVVLPEDYIKKADTVVQSKCFDIFGGPDQSFKKRSFFQEILNSVMRSYLSMGPTKYRHTNTKKKIDADESNLILCNLWVKREIFSKLKFPKNYIRNEENIFLYLAKEMGFKIGYINDLFVYHFRKENFSKLIVSTFRSGQFRMISSLEYPQSFKFIYFVPFLCLIFAIALMILDFCLLMDLVFLYLLIISISILNIFKAKISFKKYIYALMIFFVYNWVYAFGLTWGLIKRK